MEMFEKAKDKILMGAERRSMVMSEDEKKLTAYHEAGHCIVGRLVPEHDPVHKVSIIPRGRALGITLFLPEKRPLQHDQASPGEPDLHPVRRTAGGEMIFGPSRSRTGASNDIERATEICARHGHALRSVRRHGPPGLLRERGRGVPRPRCNPDDSRSPLRRRGTSTGDPRHHRPQLRSGQADSGGEQEKLHAMAEALMQYETISLEQIDNIMEGRTVQPPEGEGGKPDSRSDSGQGKDGDGRRGERPVVGGPLGEH